MNETVLAKSEMTLTRLIKHAQRDVIRFSVSILLAGVSMGANAGLFGIGGTSWTEEALLHDGRTIRVERRQSYGGYPTIDSRERTVLDEEWTFQNPDNRQKLTWKVNQRPPEGESLMLMILGIVNGTPYIASVPAGCLAYNHWGRPNPPYVFFRFDGKVWQRIAPTEFPSELKDANVVVGGRSNPENQAGTILSVSKINEENRYLESHMRQLLREPVTPKTHEGSSVDCEVLVKYKCGWGAPGEFNRKYFESTCK